MVKYIGFYLNHRSYLLRSPVNSATSSASAINDNNTEQQQQRCWRLNKILGGPALFDTLSTFTDGIAAHQVLYCCDCWGLLVLLRAYPTLHPESALLMWWLSAAAVCLLLPAYCCTSAYQVRTYLVPGIIFDLIGTPTTWRRNRLWFWWLISTTWYCVREWLERPEVRVRSCCARAVRLPAL